MANGTTRYVRYVHRGATSYGIREGDTIRRLDGDLFANPPCNLVAHEADVELPPDCQHLHHEGELVVVIGKKGRFIPPDDVRSYVFGVTVGNDVSDETWPGEGTGVEEPSRLISKACATWSPLG